MTLLTVDELKTIAHGHEQAKPLVSIFMPTHRMGAEIQQDPIRLKNLVAQAEEELVTYGLRAPEARSLIEPARTLITDSHFWQHQSDGLALFLSSDFFRTYRLPLNLQELVVVAERFHLKPLLPLLRDDGRFYVLALSQNEVRLWQATRFHIHEVELENSPTSLAEALRYDDPEKQQQFHTATDSPGGRGDRQAIFHGHGVGTDDEKTNIWRYFQQVDQGVQTLLKNETAPLVLAGVNYLLPIYEEANTYPHLLEQNVTGNPEELSAAELHERAWAVVQPNFEQVRHSTAARYQELAHTNQASPDLREIVPAAYYGRVESLFVAVDQHQWGTFNPDNNTVHLYGEAKPGADDLLDAAAIQTLLHGGTVYAVEPDQMPTQAPLAAIFRYSAP